MDFNLHTMPFVRLPFSILNLAFRTLKQPWLFQQHLVLIQLLQTLVNQSTIAFCMVSCFPCLLETCGYYFPSWFAVHQVINEGVGSILPSGLQRAILDGIFTIGRAQLSESLLNEKNPLGSSRLANLRRIFEEGKSLQLQFPAEDLGFRYHAYQTWFSN